MKESTKVLVLLIGLPILAFQLSCNKVAEKKPASISVLQERAKVSINNWVRKHPDEFIKYKPIAFEAFTARYERTEMTSYLSDKVEEEMAKPTVNQHKVDSLKNLLEKNKGILMGYTILHKYQTKNITGEVVKHEDLVFLDSTFHVATILNPDAYDMIMDLKLIFRPDSLHEQK
ncbi:MAG: hypothetical protein EHM93_06730 [Bacteroidales bacterium]|nr:MAG: hypothetical protein EHM93_06730 [Bacteroidales bacterium]